MERCSECGSWSEQCSSDTAVPDCACVRCLLVSVQTLRRRLSDAELDRESLQKLLHDNEEHAVDVVAKCLAETRHVRVERNEARSELEVAYKFHDVAVTERDAERMMNRVLRAEAADYANRLDEWRLKAGQAVSERDEAVAKVERLRNALAAISLAEYESTSSASEKVHGSARIARAALEETKP